MPSNGRVIAVSPAGAAGLSLRPEIHSHAVDAIAQMGRRRAIFENMAEMAAAAAAMHFGAGHPIAAIDRGLDRAGKRMVEARPSGSTFGFRARYEQRLTATGAFERARALLIIECATARPLGAVPAHDIVLLGREQAPPFLVGAGYREPLFLHVGLRRDARRAQTALRSSSSIDTPSGARKKATRTPGRTVVGSRVNSAPLALSSATTASMPLTVSPKWSSPW